MAEKTIRLKDENGDILEFPESSCYLPNEKGNIVAAAGGFSYFIGKPTTEPVNCVRDDGDNSLRERGGWRRSKKRKS